MNITGKYLKVWKIEDKGNFKIVDLGDSSKDKQGAYQNFTWFRCLLVSGAAQIDIRERDTIEVKNGMITMEKYNEKWSPKVIVFDAEVTKRDDSQPAQDNNSFRSGNPGSTVENVKNQFESYEQPSETNDRFEDDIPF